MSELADLSALELRDLQAQKKCSAEEIIRSCFDKVRALEPAVKAFVDLQEERAIAEARKLDRSPTRGQLHGIPVAVKDTVDVAGMRCIWGTDIHAKRVPAADATVVRRLRECGAVILGTTVTTEYAIAKAGPTTNPHDPSRSPGGSSSGSGAAVAARMVPIAVATQSVGSIIRPSSYCGVFGLKPTKSAISGDGVMPISERLDHVGPMARTITDIGLACTAMFEPAHNPNGMFPIKTIPGGTRVLRIEGPLQERIEPPTAEALGRAQKAFEDAGFSVTGEELPERFSRLISCYETIVFRDLAINHKSDFERLGKYMSPRLHEIMNIGLSVAPTQYAEALDDADYYRGYIGQLLAQNTIILAPATDGYAPILSDRTGEQKLQSLWTVAGVPSLATPCGKLDGLPLGVQVIAASGRDDLVLGAAQLIEKVYGRSSLL
jgi:Asp-tRNA(Asn)/Glu-tRNA(Gln) amidotransferase A subunit family amidase